MPRIGWLSMAILCLVFLHGSRAQESTPPAASCEELHAAAVEQAILLHDDYMKTQSRLAEVLSELKRTKREVARLKEALAQRPSADSAAATKEPPR